MVTFGEKIQDIILLMNLYLNVGLQYPMGPQRDRRFLGQTTESGIPPPFRATVRHSRIHLGF